MERFAWLYCSVRMHDEIYYVNQGPTATYAVYIGLTGATKKAANQPHVNEVENRIKLQKTKEEALHNKFRVYDDEVSDERMRCNNTLIRYGCMKFHKSIAQRSMKPKFLFGWNRENNPDKVRTNGLVEK
ncbi:unnamed protein product [Sphenostylis stenocarpa]|uniref:Uncharacterized protein n=1 Tax=Sphenostylis stenocarpa TaxID=92480 RepID=A0AA86S4M2_9FABA|nr:unnamed protein product [Sphenostylis stenocarpa]